MRQDWHVARKSARSRREVVIAADDCCARGRLECWPVAYSALWHPSIFNDPTYVVDTIRREHSPPS